MNKSENLRIGFLIFPGFPMACLTSMIEPLRAANEITDRKTFAWTLVSESGDKVISSADVGFEPDCALTDDLAVDQLFLLSAPSSRFSHPDRANGTLRRLARHGTKIGAVSGGVFPMARAGLLAETEIALHWCYAAAFAAEFPRVPTTDELIAITPTRVTAAGATAAFDLSLMMIEDAVGGDVATEVACWFQHPLVRGRGVTQRKPTLNASSTADMLPEIVSDAVQMFQDHIEDPVNVTDVADAVGVSVRQLERMFRKTTGQTPLHYYRALRMKAARQLVWYSNESLSRIAVAVGYTSTSTMVQRYRQAFGLHPLEDRDKINIFRVRDNAPVPAG